MYLKECEKLLVEKTVIQTEFNIYRTERQTMIDQIGAFLNGEKWPVNDSDNKRAWLIVPETGIKQQQRMRLKDCQEFEDMEWLLDNSVAKERREIVLLSVFGSSFCSSRLMLILIVNICLFIPKVVYQMLQMGSDYSCKAFHGGLDVGLKTG